jgi:hypothetical protein
MAVAAKTRGIASSAAVFRSALNTFAFPFVHQRAIAFNWEIVRWSGIFPRPKNYFCPKRAAASRRKRTAALRGVYPLSVFRWHNLTANFAVRISSGMHVDVPLACHQLLRLLRGQRGLPFDRFGDLLRSSQ